MPRISPKTLSLVADGKTIELKKPSKRNFELSKSLEDPAMFLEFAADPKEYAARYDLMIDQDIAAKVKTKLKGLKSLEEARKVLSPIDKVGATAWAIAVGAYSIAGSKIAVAW